MAMMDESVLVGCAKLWWSYSNLLPWPKKKRFIYIYVYRIALGWSCKWMQLAEDAGPVEARSSSLEVTRNSWQEALHRNRAKKSCLLFHQPLKCELSVIHISEVSWLQLRALNMLQFQCCTGWTRSRVVSCIFIYSNFTRSASLTVAI